MDKTQLYLRNGFSDYYRHKKIKLIVDRIQRREWAFQYFDSPAMIRHIAADRDSLGSWLAKGPRHVYNSSAYYRDPTAPMREKGWLGTVLIFDIDCDSLPNASSLGFERALELSKDEVIRLVDDFLVGDFGFQEKDMAMAFSGSRGYHVHVKDRRVLGLSSKDRREITDFVRGLNLEPGRFLREVQSGGSLSLRLLSEGGWGRRAKNCMISRLKGIGEIDRDDGVKQLMRLRGVGIISAQKICSALYDRSGIGKLENGILDLFQGSGRKDFWHELFQKCAEELSVHVDEHVTPDVSRLIRSMESLHGKSGLRVVPLARDDIERFDPFVDSVVFGDEKVRISAKEDFDFGLMGDRYGMKKGESKKVEEYAAIFAMCRGYAELGC